MQPMESLRELVDLVVANDGAAAERLVQQYGPALRRYIRLRLTDPRMRQVQDSADLSQSVLADFFKLAALGQLELDEPGQLVKLLSTMAKRKLCNRTRYSHARRRDARRLQADGWDALLGVAASGGDPLEAASNQEVLEEVRKRLDPDDLELADQWAAGRGWAEIAAGHDASAESLRKRLARALQRVARELGVEDSPS